MDNDEQDLTHEEKVAIAVVFLTDVSSINYDEEDLRKYLANKRGLTQDEIEEAFRKYRQKQMASKQSTTEKVSDPRSPIYGGRKSRLKRVQNNSSDNYDDAYEAEPTLQRKTKSPIPSLAVLIQSRQADGYNLLLNFLETEREYCSILQCLKEVYYKGLSALEKRAQISITREELREIFGRIPALLTFHRRFYDMLHQGRDIGPLFVRNFGVFQGYIEYMKNCKATIDIMRKYLLDKTLYKHLATLRARSGRKKDDMVGLLLIPLDRLLEYKKFLDKLNEWADTTQTEDFTSLSKATRRIGRVAKYTEKYKYAIANRHEMNKVQQYLQRQCVIISPNRVIIRRGIMVRRTTGWKARNKTYFFFLFNDILLWTTKRRELQNIIQLEDSEVMASNAKNDIERKFKVVTTGRKNKTLLLECTSKSQRDEWYSAVENAIAVSKKKGQKREWPKCLFSPKKTVENKFALTPGACEMEDILKSDDVEYKDNDVEDSDSSRKEPDDYEASFDAFYEESCHFKQQNQDLKEFDPMDDTISQMSEVDRDEYFLIGPQGLSPCVKSPNASVENNFSWDLASNKKLWTDQNKKKIQREAALSKSITRTSGENRISRRSGEEDDGRQKASIIRCRSKDTAATREQKRDSSFIVRLNDL